MCFFPVILSSLGAQNKLRVGYRQGILLTKEYRETKGGQGVKYEQGSDYND